MITFGDILKLAIFIGVAILIINWLVYECQESKQGEMWEIIHGEIDNFIQFLASLKSANDISAAEINWYVNKYCRIEREEITDNFMLESLNRRDALLGERHLCFYENLNGTTEKFNLMDKYKNTENFNEVEFFQGLNEALKKERPRERNRIERAINRGCYMEQSGKYICDFNNVVELEVDDLGSYGGNITKISLRCGAIVNAQGVEVVELFNKWKRKQNLI